MPIYAYKCDTCGHSKDVLRKISDPPLTDCPSCGAATFTKQLTAAGFQLKGSGWYVTDFRDGNTAGAPKPAGEDGKAASASDGAKDGADSKPAEAAKAPAAETAKTESKSAAPAASATPAASPPPPSSSSGT
jgi:putative FmdB family regulatory protein